MAEHGLSRRDFLKRGAIVGGAIVWTTPVIQAVGMRPALAQDTSPVCDNFYRVKLEDGPNDTFTCDDEYSGGSAGDCFTAAEVAGTEDGCDKIESVVQSDNGRTWTITVVEGCELDNTKVGVKDGSTTGPACTDDFTATQVDDRTIVVNTGGADEPRKEISHVELIFCCDH